MDAAVVPRGLAEMPPGPALAAVLGAIELGGVPNDRILDVLGAQNRQLSHEQARMIATIAEVGRCAGYPAPGAVDRRPEPDRYASEETRAALRWTRNAAECEHEFAETVVHDMPEVFAAWWAGELDRQRVRVFDRYLLGLSSDLISRISRIAVPRAPRLTTGQLAVLLRRMVIAADPDAAARWYRTGIQRRGVVAHPAPDGTITITASGLPADEAEAACVRIEQIADAAKLAGHPARIGQIRCDLFLGLLDGRFHGMTIAQVIAALLAQHAAGAQAATAGHHDGSSASSSASERGSRTGSEAATSRPAAASRGRAGESAAGTATNRATTASGTTEAANGTTETGTTDTTYTGTTSTTYTGPTSTNDTTCAAGTPTANHPSTDRTTGGRGTTDPTADGTTIPDAGTAGSSETDTTTDRTPGGGATTDSATVATHPATDRATGGRGATSGSAATASTTDRATGAVATGGGRATDGNGDHGNMGAAADNSADCGTRSRDDHASGGRCAPATGVGPCREQEGAGDDRRGIEIRIALTTLLGRDEHPAEIPGVGLLVAPVARHRVALQRRAQWRFAVTDAEGHLVTEGVTRRRPWPRAPGPPGGVVELHVPAALLHELMAGESTAAGEWAGVVADIARQHSRRHDHLRDLDARPGDRLPSTALRRHTEIRDRTCIHPCCRRRARASEQDHTRDHASGGATVRANLGPSCPHDHDVKHEGGWLVEQPEPGTFVWRSPLGGEYRTRGTFLDPPMPASAPADPAPEEEDAFRYVEGPILRQPPRIARRAPPPTPPVDPDEPPPF